MARVLMEEINGWRIEFDQEQGTFYGIPRQKEGRPSWETRGLVLKRRDLAALRHEITKRSMGQLRLMRITWLSPGHNPMIPTPLTVGGMEGDRIRTLDGRLERSFYSVALYDQEIVDRVTEFRDRMTAAQKAIQEEYNAYLAELDLKSLQPDQIRELLTASSKAGSGDAASSRSNE